jgi:hypothetical protein
MTSIPNPVDLLARHRAAWDKASGCLSKEEERQFVAEFEAIAERRFAVKFEAILKSFPEKYPKGFRAFRPVNMPLREGDILISEDDFARLKNGEPIVAVAWRKEPKFPERDAEIIRLVAEEGLRAKAILARIKDRWPTMEGGNPLNRQCIQRVITKWRRKQRNSSLDVQK